MIAADSREGHLVPASALTLNDAGELGLRLVDEDGHVSFAPATVLRDTEDGMWLAGLPEEIGAIIVGQRIYPRGGHGRSDMAPRESRAMIGIVSWAATHARMVLALLAMTLGAGAAAYFGLPRKATGYRSARRYHHRAFSRHQRG